jgi:hypothetical protein
MILMPGDPLYFIALFNIKSCFVFILVVCLVEIQSIKFFLD